MTTSTDVFTLPELTWVTYHYSYPSETGPLSRDTDGRPMRVSDIQITVCTEDGDSKILSVEATGYGVTKNGARDRRAQWVRRTLDADLDVSIATTFHASVNWRAALTQGTP